MVAVEAAGPMVVADSAVVEAGAAPTVAVVVVVAVVHRAGEATNSVLARRQPCPNATIQLRLS